LGQPGPQSQGTVATVDDYTPTCSEFSQTGEVAQSMGRCSSTTFLPFPHAHCTAWWNPSPSRLEVPGRARPQGWFKLHLPLAKLEPPLFANTVTTAAVTHNNVTTVCENSEMPAEFKASSYWIPLKQLPGRHLKKAVRKARQILDDLPYCLKWQVTPQTCHLPNIRKFHE
jgi:hypothetical protein